MKKLKGIFCIALCFVLIFGTLAACLPDSEDETETVTVIFVANTEATVSDFPAQQTITKGSKVARPDPNPSRSGYNFDGWFIDEECSAEFDFDTPINARTFIYAGWSQNKTYFAVTLNLNYPQAPTSEVVNVESGKAMDVPEEPLRAGYRFVDWAVDEDGNNIYDFENATVTASFSLYAIWEQVFVVTFNYNHSEAPANTVLTIKAGDSASLPSTAGKGPTGLIFAGWFTDTTYSTPFDRTAVSGDATVYARWVEPGSVEAQCTVTFDLNYSGAPTSSTQQGYIGTVATRPDPDPERDNWIFKDWYTQSSGGSVYNFGTLSGDITIYARWQARYQLNYNYTGAPTQTATYFDEGQNIPSAPVAPIRAANPTTGNEYTFAGWSTTPDGEGDFDGFGTAFDGNLTLYAQWQHKYVFEAEYTDLDDITGSSISGSPKGTGIIAKEKSQGGYPAVEASNDFYLSYLYGNGIKVFYEINSDRACSATFWVRLSNEFEPMRLTQDTYRININGVKFEYEPFYAGEEIFDSSTDYWWNLEGLMVPFYDWFGVTVQLNEGRNVIELITNNSDAVGGTLGAVAPVVDCIKLETTARLTWTPKYSNLNSFLGNNWWLN